VKDVDATDYAREETKPAREYGDRRYHERSPFRWPGSLSGEMAREERLQFSACG
jgi:hypothetical protein